MRCSLFLFTIVVFLCAVPASAQGILPASFAGWTGAPQAGIPGPAIANGDDAASIVASRQTATRQEYGFISAEQAAYSRGNEKLQVTLYRMKDPSGAYGMYSYLRSPDMPQAGVTDHSAMSRERALVLDGILVIDVHGTDLQRLGNDLNALVAAVSPKADQGPLPTISEHLPTKGFIERSDKYILGPVTLNQFFPVNSNDWLGFGTGAEAEVARYHVDGRELNLLLADFPTPQTAQKKLTQLQQDYHVNAPATNTNNSPIFARRSITLLAIVSGARTPEEANKLLDQIQSGTEVTWNEPTFQFKEPPITTMIVGAIIGTGVICCFALISGLAFGGFRLVVKRWLPDKVFDRSSQMQVLQLGLGSKPINSEDFYGIERRPLK
ncbi:MAG: DUF6599 family protein [Candidatus Acidiferrales bacterium]